MLPEFAELTPNEIAHQAKEIEENKKRLIEIQNSFPVLEQELFEIKNRIKKIGE